MIFVWKIDDLLHSNMKIDDFRMFPIENPKNVLRPKFMVRHMVRGFWLMVRLMVRGNSGKKGVSIFLPWDLPMLKKKKCFFGYNRNILPL